MGKVAHLELLSSENVSPIPLCGSDLSYLHVNERLDLVLYLAKRFMISRTMTTDLADTKPQQQNNNALDQNADRKPVLHGGIFCGCGASHSGGW